MLELECTKMDKAKDEEGVGKKVDPYPLIYGQTKLCVPTGLVKLAFLPSAAINGVVGLPTSVLMRIPE